MYYGNAFSLPTVVEKINCEFLQKVSIFDVYEGENVPQGQKSLGLSFNLQHRSRTLVDAEVDSWINNVISALEHSFGITIRDDKIGNSNKK